MKLRLMSAVLAILVAVTFVPVTGDLAFADETGTEMPVAKAFDKRLPVKGVTCKGYTYKSVTIGWNPVDEAAGYQIFRATKKSGKYKKIKTTTGLSYKDSGNRTLGKNKYYKVRAYGKVGRKTVYGAYSKKFAARPNMPAPTVKTASEMDTVTISWNKVAGAKKYAVYRATSIGGKYSRVKTVSGCSYSNLVTKDKTYYYKVRPYRKSKGGVTSSPVAGLARLDPPRKVAAKAYDGAVSITWSAVSKASFYEIYRATSSAGEFEKVGETTGTDFEDTDNLQMGNTYFYKVRAVASVNGSIQYGRYSAIGGRDRMMEQALDWYGKREADKSNQVIISVFNKKMGTGFSYKTPWCAIFVSACAIETGNSKAIPLTAACSEMVSKFKKWKVFRNQKNYTPKSGDVVIYDWPKHNNVADHVGLVVSYDSGTKSVTAIEGNTRGSERSKFSGDSVAFRYYKVGYEDILGYGTPNYSDKTGASVFVNWNTDSAVDGEENLSDPVEQQDVEEATAAALGEAAEPAENTEGTAALENAEAAESPQSPETDMEKVMNVVEYIEEENPSAGFGSAEEAYDAFLVMNVCEELDIEACVLITLDENGNQVIWNELELDGQTYTLDPSEEGATPEKLTPEKAN